MPSPQRSESPIDERPAMPAPHQRHPTRNLQAFRQPIHDDQNRMFAYELLARRGDGPLPLSFSQIAPEFSCKEDWYTLDSLMLCTATRAAAKGDRVFFNLSNDTLLTPHLLSAFLTQMEAANALLPAGGELVAEIHEDFVVDEQFLRHVLDAIRSTGTKVAMDDHLGRPECFRKAGAYPWDYIKLDISARHHGCPLATFERLRASQACTIIEGVETLEAFTRWRTQGAALFQGFYLGIPHHHP